MARIRSLKPTFWTDEKIGLLPRDVRLTFIGLISAMADDDGRMRGNSRIVRGAVYAFDDDVTSATIEQHLQLLSESGRIVRYQVAGDDFIAIRHWRRHQKIDKPSPSLLPPPPADFMAEVVDPNDGQTGSESDSPSARRGQDSESPNVRRPFPTDEDGSGVDGNGEVPSSASSSAPKADANVEKSRARLGAAESDEAVRRLYPRVAEALPPDGTGRDLLLELMKSVGDARAYLAELTATLDGMHGVMLTPAEMRIAVTDWLANNERPNLRRFRGYLRGVKAKAPAQAVATPVRRASGAQAASSAGNAARRVLERSGGKIT